MLQSAPLTCVVHLGRIGPGVELWRCRAGPGGDAYLLQAGPDFAVRLPWAGCGWDPSSWQADPDLVARLQRTGPGLVAWNQYRSLRMGSAAGLRCWRGRQQVLSPLNPGSSRTDGTLEQSASGKALPGLVFTEPWSELLWTGPVPTVGCLVSSLPPGC